MRNPAHESIDFIHIKITNLASMHHLLAEKLLAVSPNQLVLETVNTFYPIVTNEQNETFKIIFYS